MTKKYFLSVGIVVLIAAGSWFVYRGMTERGYPPPTGSYDEPIHVIAPQWNGSVATPITITGEARGSWFFEGSFPVRVKDEAGTILGSGIAHANGEWMTDAFVPFTASVDFSSAVDQKGSLVFEKDNPSGLPANDASISIPVQLKKTDEMRFNVFFGNKTKDPDVLHCDRAYPVERTALKTKAVARAAMDALLLGPSAAEKAEGYWTALPDGIHIQHLTVANGIASIDFDDALERGNGGACQGFAIRAEIEQTLLQFSTVKRVVLSINGKTEDILQP